MDFKLWSQLNKDAKEELSPDFGFRSWDKIVTQDKAKIWQYLKSYFFNKDIKKDFNHEFNESGLYYEFYGDESEERFNKRVRINRAVLMLNHLHKSKSYGVEFLESQTYNSACRDFYRIFMNESENVVMELLSLYAKALIVERSDVEVYRHKEEADEAYQKRSEAWKWLEFDEFTERFNEVFQDFSLNIQMTRLGLIPRQEEKIMEEVYKPVIASLSNPKWKEVGRLLSDSFTEYRKNTDNGYSNSVTNTVSAVQAFLQILINGETGKGNISYLISECQKKSLVPPDFFTQTIFKNMESIFARERQETGIAHPKNEYATDKNARMVLNLAMVFFQHCL